MYLVECMRANKLHGAMEFTLLILQGIKTSQETFSPVASFLSSFILCVYKIYKK